MKEVYSMLNLGKIFEKDKTATIANGIKRPSFEDILALANSRKDDNTPATEVPETEVTK